jgi:hypothetical protein
MSESYNREYDPDLAESIKEDKCPDCGGEGFLKGPEGGMSSNIMCANPECGSRFNVCPPTFAANVWFAQRISPPSPLLEAQAQADARSRQSRTHPEETGFESEGES